MTQKKISLVKGIGVSLLVVLLTLNFASGLLFLQDQTDISESYTAEQTTIITLLNDQPRSQNIIIQVAPSSQYLLSYIDIEDTTLTLIPGEKKNVLINTQIEEGILSPETHIIELIARSDDDKSIAKTKIIFSVEGVAKPNLEIISEEYDLDNAEKILSFELENSGNIIMRPRPEIQIKKDNINIKNIEYKTPIQIMPGRTYPLSMRLDTSSIEEGTYTVQVTFFDRNNIALSSKIQTFTIKSNYEESTNPINFTTPLIIGGIFIALIGSLFGVNALLRNKEKPINKIIRRLERKEQQLDKKLQKLINQTHQTVNTTNKWIKKNLGEKYELR